MTKLSLKFTWLIFLIPIGMFVFVGFPQFQRMYTDFNTKVEEVRHEALKLERLQQIEHPTRQQANEITKLSIWVPIHQQSLRRQKFMFYKTGGMVLVLGFMFLGMILTRYYTTLKKKSRSNTQITFNFEDPDNDAIGQHISWAATIDSGSNFLSEKLKKIRTGYKVSSTHYLKVIAWAFFLIGLNYLVFSSAEFYLNPLKTLSFMEGGKLFFTSGGPFVLIGIFLLLGTRTKVTIHLRDRKVQIGSDIIPFREIYALQLVQKFVQGHKTGGYHCYELNIVTTTGHRHNILNHGDKEYMLSDMVKLSTLFNIPVWNRGVM